MAFAETYRRQVALLVRILPAITEEECFALKGGTAINLFVRDLPRLSVDIDLTYLPVKDRTESLTEITEAIRRISDRLKAADNRIRIGETADNDGFVRKLAVRDPTAMVKIEVTPVLRGCVYAPELRQVRPPAEEAFGFAEARIVSFADLYGGKLVAALDRQHPRDLFDVRDLLANEGFTDEVRIAFLIYLASHDRPMAEVIAPPRKDITEVYERHFSGMTGDAVPLAELVATRERLIAELIGDMPRKHRDFLIGFEEGKPDWDLIGLPDAASLPAIRWRQMNLDGLKKDRRDELVKQLKEALE
ncbi:nucleotidyl transferase AbiEii/AbiGii toxin family protein [Agrobacterium larrymoorei]|uniref:nucleotidyl transferase AbiEii/AbiGii toxin family protein n=1 Tax=Agrobacterium larrymoorei TaxID=160699 RepID=UPI0030BACBFB